MKTKNPKPEQIKKSYTDGPALIRFDWAIKRLWRQKANYTVLEGFLSVLIGENIKIINIKESESNKENPQDGFNRVDIMCENNHGELFIIEMQSNSEADYFLRMQYGVAKAITEHRKESDPYMNVRKVYHINIVYFRLGTGKDYVYRGVTEFRGIHKNDILQLTTTQKKFFAAENRKNVKAVQDLFSEYFVLCVKNFDDVAENSLDEWIYYFKNNTIPEEFNAPGLKEAREQLKYDNLTEQEKVDYHCHLDRRLYEDNTIKTSRFEGEVIGEARGLKKGEAIGLEKGEAIGLEKGEAKAMIKTVLNSHRAGFSLEQIQLITKLSPEQITEILKQHDLK
jgi:predicted transposase/invertase (TIGR01784 family)